MPKNRKKDRGFYKPKSYRFSDENHKFLKEIGLAYGSQEKAMTALRKTLIIKLRLWR